MTRPDLKSERGITMIAVVIVMAVATVLATGALLAAQQDLPFSKASSDRKQAYAAAEAGVEYYMYQLTNDNDYWTRCANVPAPAPVNQQGANPRKWRTLSGTTAKYTIESCRRTAAVGSLTNQCIEGSADTTMLNQSTARSRSVRPAGPARPPGRSWPSSGATASWTSSTSPTLRRSAPRPMRARRIARRRRTTATAPSTATSA